jgi:REP element-mobilizing transposase RayT
MRAIADENEKTWGGRREGAGRKKSPLRRYDVPHRARPQLAGNLHPVHVSLRIDRRVRWRLRCGKVLRTMRRVLQHYLGRDAFRVCHISIQHNHLHFLVEATDKRALTYGMRSLTIRSAQAIQHAFGIDGRIFAHRYHAVQILTARQARNSLAYVVNNWRRHREDLVNARAMAAKVDPYSSGLAFTGWKGSPRWRIPTDLDLLPVSEARTNLLARDWKRFGLIDPSERSGPLW